MDINDAKRAGHDLASLLAAADSGDPIDVRTDEQAMLTAQAGLDQLGATVDAMGSAQGREDQAKLYAEITDDDDTMRALGYAYRLRRGGFMGEVERLRQVKGFGTAARELEKEVRRIADAQEAALRKRIEQSAASSQGRLIDQLTRDLGVTGLRVPRGYEVDADGVWVQQGEDAPKLRLTHAPVVLAGLSQDLHTDQVRVRLCWRRRDGWSVHTVSRGTVMDARALVSLSAVGCPVTTSNGRDLAEYLAAFEAANMGTLPDTRTASHMGWVSSKTFVVGADSYGGDVRLVAEGGLEALASGYRAGGTWEGWCAAVDELLADRPLAMLGIYAAACTPLLRILDQPGFVVDWSGETSMGKTTTLRCAASVWGVPDDRGEGIILSWASSSMVGPMTVAHFNQSLPVILDDTKRGKPTTIGAVLYDLPAGQERMKGTADGGLRAIRRWRTCLLSTGEAPITSFSQAGGTRARTIVLRGAPFGEPNDENRRAAEAVTLRLLEHHGHLGRRLVERLVKPDGHAWLRGRFAALREEYASTAPSAVAGRLAAYVAILRLAAEVCEMLGMPKPRDCDPIGLAWQAALDSATEADPPTEALRAMYSWAVAHSDRFEGRRPAHLRDMPPQGWAGQWTATRLGFNVELTKELLERWKYDVEGVLDAWHRRGWTATNPGRRTLKVRIGVDYDRLIAFDLGAYGVPLPLETKTDASA